MPYDMELQAIAHHVWAWLDKNPGALAEKRLVRIYRKAQRQAMEEFATKGVGGDKQHSLSRRFGEAYGRQVTPRSEKYMERVRKFYGGRYLPFTSPTRNGSTNKGHMRDLIKKPTTGFRIAARNGTDIVTTRMYLPAARGLNAHPVYRPEFLALDTTNRMDAEAIEQRTQELAIAALRHEINRTEARRIRMAKSVAKDLTI